MILLDQTKQTSTPSLPIEMTPQESKEGKTLSFAQLLGTSVLKEEGQKLDPKGVAISLQDTNEKGLPTQKSERSPTQQLQSLLMGDGVKVEETQSFTLNPSVAEKMSDVELRVLGEKAKNYLKNKILESEGYKKAQITELPKTLKGLVEAAQKFGVDVSKITLEELDADNKLVSKVQIQANQVHKEQKTQTPLQQQMQGQTAVNDTKAQVVEPKTQMERAKAQTLVNEIKVKTPEPKVQTATGEQKVQVPMQETKAPILESKVQAENPKMQMATGEQKIQTPLWETKAQTTVADSKVQSTGVEAKVQTTEVKTQQTESPKAYVQEQKVQIENPKLQLATEEQKIQRVVSEGKAQTVSNDTKAQVVEPKTQMDRSKVQMAVNEPKVQMPQQTQMQEQQKSVQKQGTPLFVAQSSSKKITTQQIISTKVNTVVNSATEVKSPKQKADDTLKMLLRGERAVSKDSGLTPDFSVATAKVIAPQAATDARQNLESLLRGETQESAANTTAKTDGMNINKAESLETKLGEAKQMTKYLSADVKTAIEDYKSPFTRVKVQLNPQKFGEVDLTVVQRGKNLHINLSSNNSAINTLALNANDLKVQLTNSGINNASLNFNNNSQGSESSFSGGQQHSQNGREAHKEYESYNFESEEMGEELQSSLEIVVPNYA